MAVWLDLDTAFTGGSTKSLGGSLASSSPCSALQESLADAEEPVAGAVGMSWPVAVLPFAPRPSVSKLYTSLAGVAPAMSAPMADCRPKRHRPGSGV